MRSLARRSVLVFVSTAACVLGCVTPRPSPDPLGWGPLPPGAQKAAGHTREKKVARAEAPAPSEEERTATSDAGGTTPEKSAALPSASASAGAPPVASASTAPSSAGPKSAAVAAFVGEFSGEDVATYRMSGLPDRTERDPKARINVKTSDAGDLLFVLIDSSNGKEICTLSGTLKDSSVTIGSGQKCFEQNEGAASAGATVTKGTATMEKNRLLFDLDLDFEMTAEGHTLQGSLVYHFEGKRR